ncbi:ABC-2 transporter permease [Hamadaea tsunoensis]|uniref:ABC-2 transporter permease n=1 Tax=Hamadaea tsunoensis TaxID=53368 RepID=UPI0003F8C021|nr:ABC-2 transporter permease [Hamadaea tsunoensis]
MNAVFRATVLHMRSVAPYRTQFLLVLALMVVLDLRSPTGLMVATAVILAPYLAVQPFQIADKADLTTLYAVLPVTRRAVLLAYYAWAVVVYLGALIVGTALSYVAARVEGDAFGGGQLTTLLTMSWALFAVNVAVQFPLLIRFGYTRVNVLATILPIALIMLAAYKLHLTIDAGQVWLPLLGVAGAAVLVISATLTAHVFRHPE